MERIAYLDDNRSWEKKNINPENLSCINYAFADIVAGKVQRPLKRIHLINELKMEFPKLKTCISIGGWGGEGFSDAALTKESRQVFIDSLLAYMEKYQFDGVDLDWEYPGLAVAGITARSDDGENFLLLLKEIRQALQVLGQRKGQDYLLTIAVGAAPELLEAATTRNGHEYVAYLDHINVMTYDMRGSFSNITGHHTNLYPYQETDELSVDASVKHLLAAGVPPEKIVIGGAFYGRVWRGVTQGQTEGLIRSAATPGDRAIDYQELKQLLAANPACCFYDEQAEAPYYFDGAQFISYDDQRSLAAKVRYVQANGLRGMMYWEHSLDLSGELLSAIVAAAK